MAIKVWPRGLVALGLAAAVAAVAVSGVVGAIALLTVHKEIERQLDHRIELETMSLLVVYQTEGLKHLVKVVRTREAYGTPGRIGYLAGAPQARRGMGYIVTDAAGKRLAGDLDARTPKPGWSELLRFRRQDGSEGVAQAMSVALGSEGWLVVAADRATVRQTDMTLLRMIAAHLVLVLLILAGAIVGFSFIVRRRLSAIRDTARAIMDGDLSRRIALHPGESEFNQLAVELNRMLDRIATLLENLRQVSSDIAHDLRTPLTRLRHNIEAALLAKDPQAAHDRLDAALDDADGALDLFTGLLAISEVEGQQTRTRFRLVKLADAVEKIVEAYEPALEAARVELSLDLQPVTTWGDQVLLQRATASLLDNLIAHTPAGTRARLALVARNGGARLSLADDGPGVPAHQLSRIFERLVRLDPARSGPGYGLGLSMVGAIVRAHGGEVGAFSDAHGFRVEISLPPIETG